MPKKSTKPKQKLTERQLRMSVRRKERALDQASKSMKEMQSAINILQTIVEEKTGRIDNLEMELAEAKASAIRVEELESQLFGKTLTIEEAERLLFQISKELIDSRELADRYHRRNRRMHKWIKRRHIQFKALLSTIQTLRQDAENLKVERKQYELASTIFGFIFVNTIDNFTHEEKIRHVMNVTEFLGINFNELGDTIERALVCGYAYALPMTVDRLLHGENEG